jgi:DNA helicase-2/ATP-dependent DNA helicase PcrA
VAITRAKQTLTISHARQRMLYGRTNAALKSRFLNEIPEDCIVRKGGYKRVEQPVYGFGNYGTSYGNYAQPAKTVETPRYSIQSDRPKQTQPASYLELNKGDMVLHGVFGKGMVLSVMKMGGDALLEIAFDDIGTKKLMAKTASVHMKKL